MLELAYVHRDKLRAIYTRALLEPKAMYYYMDPALTYELTIDDNEWKRIQMVSLNSKNEITAYLGAWVDRTINLVHRLEIINFSNPDFESSRDLFRFLKIIFQNKGFRKAMVQVIKENPAAQMYRKFITENNLGKEVGTYKEHIFLPDGNYHDMVIFEIYRENYIKWVSTKNI